MTGETTNMRREYQAGDLEESRVSRDPFEQFQRWFDEAAAAGTLEPNAMAVATVDEEGRPSQRMVLLKRFDNDGFVFYTNYASQKGVQLAHNPHVALLFYWPEAERQVRILGNAEQTSSVESDAYFASRPRGSQIGSAASPQSEVVPDRDWLATRFETFRRTHENVPIARPGHWGGVRVVPREFEFWQGRPNRLHDRLRYRQRDDGWSLERLAP